MEFEDFYELAEYGNLNWKGSYTHKEVACNAHTYTMEWEESKRTGKYTDTLTTPTGKPVGVVRRHNRRI